MSFSVVRGSTAKPVASESLVQIIKASGIDGELYIGYPILASVEKGMPIDALLLSPELGVILFDLIEGGDTGPYIARQEDAANKLDAKLRTHSDLVERRQLLVSISTISFGPALSTDKLSNDEPNFVANADSLVKVMGLVPRLKENSKTYERVLSVLQNISSIRQSRQKRVISQETSRGARLKKLEDSIATLDSIQSRAVIETVDGVQRIRGLAGSGKTIVLALKAAYLHAQHPDWRIAVTFNTRSLKGQFRRLINTFCIAQTGIEPDWDQIRVINAWGAPGGPSRDGLYYEFCQANGCRYYDWLSAKDAFNRDTAFGRACKEALETAKDHKSLYDVILVDEAQDFDPSFLRLCYNMLSDSKRLVYAYDELQNLAGESVPPPETLFGLRPDGSAMVSLEDPTPTGARRDIILEVCYRNSRPVLSTAHALGFGIYRNAPKGATTGLVQMFERESLWEDVGYVVEEGELISGHHVTLKRSDLTSPSFLENHSPIDDLVQFIKFNSAEEQAEWLVSAIKTNVTDDELRYDDIVVINPDPLKTRTAVGPIRTLLYEKDIASHVAGVDTDPDIFFSASQDSITFTGIFRAKGNEAGMVYVINGQDCHSAWNLAKIRNQLFTAMTRSKAWVRVLGFGSAMDALIAEFNKVVVEDFKLSFRYPTHAEREQLAIVHRDVSPTVRKKIEQRSLGIGQLVEEIESGEVHLEDLDPASISKLKELLEKMEG